MTQVTRHTCLSWFPFLWFQLKAERELDKLKGLKLAELWLDSNPLCSFFKDQAAYIRSAHAHNRRGDGGLSGGRILGGG